jgi:hypothetical protein
VRSLLALFLAAAPIRVLAQDFSGLWETEFGRLRLTQKSGNLSGLYSLGGGTLTGAAQGASARLRYHDSSDGQAEFTLSDGGAAFTGRWRPDGSRDWKPWNGRRVDVVADRRWLYVVESRWEENIAEREYTYGEVLKTFFAHAPNVQVRQRFFDDSAGLFRWLREAAFLAEPVIVYVSSHGTPEGLETSDGPVGAGPIADALKGAPNVVLLHFGSCELMKGAVADDILTRLGSRRFPISGFTEAVDWGGSAIADMAYLDLMLSHGLAPEEAARRMATLVPFSVKNMKDSPFGALGFKLRR